MIQVHELSCQGAYEALTGAADCLWMAYSPSMDAGQYLHSEGSCRKHQGGQGKSTLKIEEAIAAIIGLDRTIRCGNNARESVCDSRGLLFYKEEAPLVVSRAYV